MLVHVLQPLVIGMAALTPAPGGADALSHLTPTSADTVTYRIDVGHSELTFRIRQLMSRVNGTFNQWSGVITAADRADWSTGSVEVVIQSGSIDTRHEKRDSDLQS